MAGWTSKQLSTKGGLRDSGGLNPVGPSDHSCLGISDGLVGKELGKKLGGEDEENSEWEGTMPCNCSGH